MDGQCFAVEAERCDRCLGYRKGEQTGETRQAIGDIPAGKASAAEPAHECGYHHGGGIHVRAREDHQHALPRYLIQERGKSGDEESGKRRDEHEGVNMFPKAQTRATPRWRARREWGRRMDCGTPRVRWVY
jgi:hypothetical protein